MGSQSRRSKKSNRKRDDPIHVAREREATLREEEKKRNNRERQAQYRAKRKADLEASSLAPPIDSTPPPSDSVPPSSPPVCHSPLVLHDPIPSLSPTYILPPSSSPITSHFPSPFVPPLFTSHDVGGSSAFVATSSTSIVVATTPLLATSPIHHEFGTPPSCPILGASSHGKSLSKSGAQKRANIIVSRFFDDLDVPSQSRVLDSLLQHSSMERCTSALQISSPHSRRATAHVLHSLRASYSSIKHTAHKDGVGARRTILAAVSGSDSHGMYIFFLF